MQAKHHYQLLLLVFCFSFNQLMAQNYGNEWVEEIGYDKTFYKFKILNEGLHRIEYGVLVEIGISLDAENLKLFSRGQEIPIYISTNGIIQEGDFIEFYGQPNNGYFDTQLYSESVHHPCPQYSLFEDEGTYFLVSDANTNGLRFEPIENDITNPPIAESHFIKEKELDNVNTFQFGEPEIGLGAYNHYTANFSKGEGFGSQTLQYFDIAGNIYNNKNYDLDTKGAIDGTASISTRIFGRNRSSGVYFDKDFVVSINDLTYVEVYGSDEANSTHDLLHAYDIQDYNFSFPIANGEDSVKLKYEVFDGVGASGLPFETEIAIGYTSINYPHGFDFYDSKAFLFEVEIPERKYFEISNFDGGTNPIIYDLSSYKRIEPIVENGIYKFGLEADETNLKRKLYIANRDEANIHYPLELTPRNFKNVNAESGNYIIVYNKVLQEGTCTDQIQRYIDYRSSEEGGAYEVVAYEIEDLYDVFAHGINSHPLSIKQFVNYAVDNWDIQPEYLNIIGKGVQYNTRRYLEAADSLNLIPSFGHKTSDLFLTTRNINDYLPQLALGRLPVYNCNQLNDYIDKLEAYESLYNTCDLSELEWMNDAMFIAKGWHDETDFFLDFLMEQEEIIENNFLNYDVVATLSNDGGIISGQSCDEYIEYFAQLYDDQTEFQNLINSGLNLINYIGHSVYQYWQFDTGYVSDLDNQGKYPVIFSSSGFVGRINEYITCQGEVLPSMSEEWVLEKDKGAIAFLGYTSLNSPSINSDYIKRLLEIAGTEELYDLPLGKSILELNSQIQWEIEHGIIQGELAQEYSIVSSHMTLCGDPAIKLYTAEPNIGLADFTINESNVTLSENEIYLNDETELQITYNYSNLGTVLINGSMVLNIALIDENGSIVLEIQAPTEQDSNYGTLGITIPIDDSFGGEYTLALFIDAENQIEEFCEENNYYEVPLNIVNCNDVLSVTIEGITQICEGDTTQLGLNISGVYNSIVWNNGATSDSLLITEAGVYEVTIIDENLCEAIANVEVSYLPAEDCIVGLFKEISAEQIMIYPSPAHDFVTLYFEDLTMSNFIIEIYNSEGKQLIHKNYSTKSEAQINIQNFNSGIYYLKLIDENNNMWTGKFLKE